MLLFLLVVLTCYTEPYGVHGKKKIVGKETITFVIINLPTNTANRFYRTLDFNIIINNIRDNNAYKKIDWKNYCLVVFK